MCTHAEKRASERHCFAANIAFSYFNNEISHGAQILNIGPGGMCFRSNLFLQPGAIIIVRLEKIHPNGYSSGYCKHLRSVTLAEVKWCHEIPGEASFPFVIGAKYFETVF